MLGVKGKEQACACAAARDATLPTGHECDSNDDVIKRGPGTSCQPRLERDTLGFGGIVDFVCSGAAQLHYRRCIILSSSKGQDFRRKTKCMASP